MKCQLKNVLVFGLKLGLGCLYWNRQAQWVRLTILYVQSKKESWQYQPRKFNTALRTAWDKVCESNANLFQSIVVTRIHWLRDQPRQIKTFPWKGQHYNRNYTCENVCNKLRLSNQCVKELIIATKKINAIQNFNTRNHRNHYTVHIKLITAINTI